MTLPPDAVLKKRRAYVATPGPAPRWPHGKLKGRPRGDATVLAVLDDTWTLAPVIAERLGKSYLATLQALNRAYLRGLIEHRRGRGYRRKRGAP